MIDNRRGDVEVLADVKISLNALSDVLNMNAGERDCNWLDDLRDKHLKRIQKTGAQVNDNVGHDGKIHPMAIFDAIAQVATDDYIAVADGGDLLSFARIGLEADTYMDAGAFGCLGVGVPFAIAASLAYPNRICLLYTSPSPRD